MVEWRPVDSGVVDAVRSLLADQGPLDEDQFLAALETAGVDLGGDPEGTLDAALEDEDLDLAVPLVNGQWVWLPALLTGRVFTHRLTAREVAHDLLDVTPDLEPVSTLTDSDTFTHLADGTPVIEVLAPFDADVLAERDIPADAVDEGGGLLLPRGYLNRAGLAAGDLVGVRVTGAGLVLEPVDKAVDEPPADAVPERLRAVMAAVEDGLVGDGPVEVAAVVWAACAQDPALFTRPLPPLCTAIEAAGLAREGEWLASGGFDFARWRTGNRLAGLAERYDLDEDEALAVLVMALLYERVADLMDAAHAAQRNQDTAALADLLAHLDGPPDHLDQSAPVEAAGSRSAGAGMRATMRQAVRWLAEPAVAEAVLAETMGTSRDGAAALGLFAETLEPLAPRATRVALRWLHGKALERLGQIVEAEATYHAAEALDPDWPPVLVDLAHYASDRSDATRSLTLLRRAGAPADDPLVQLLARFETMPRSDLGRNQPCWCGSGRKYKQCHLGREQAPLTERAGWLYEKAAQFTLEGPWQDTVHTVARERARFADTPQQLIGAFADPLVLDTVLFEGGAFADFLTTRGCLLPEDERLLAEQWLLVDRSLYDVQNVHPGTGLTVRDVRTGDMHDVTEHAASRQLTAGDLICARIVPVNDNTMQIFGGVEPVALHQRDDLIALLDDEPDPLDLVALLTRRFAPPTLCNTEAEPLVLCEVTLRTLDPADLEQTLNQTYTRVDDHAEATPAEWAEHVTTDNPQHIRATLRLDGDHLHVQTNSEPRLERVLATLRAAQPAITVISESRQPARDLREAQHLAVQQPKPGKGQPLDPSDPQVAAALNQVVRRYEQRWLDEPIPALAGHTPRECAADPTRRPDLIRLLESFPNDQDNPGIMQPDRLRAALGLA